MGPTTTAWSKAQTGAIREKVRRLLPVTGGGFASKFVSPFFLNGLNLIAALLGKHGLKARSKHPTLPTPGGSNVNRTNVLAHTHSRQRVITAPTKCASATHQRSTRKRE
eukprot:6011988-Pyramimonas_sp.AAC.1